MKSQKELIKHFDKQAQKAMQSHGMQSEYFMKAYFDLIAAKNGLEIKDIFPFAEKEMERQKQITLDAIDCFE